MSSGGDYDTRPLVDPIDFYNIIMNNIDKFSDNEKFSILRFFDKMADSTGFSCHCKYRLKYHVDNKHIKDKALCIFDSNLKCNKIEVLGDIAYLNRTKSGWEFILGGESIIKGIDDSRALKIVKDVNNLFLNKREDF